jgi:predicted metal-binding protein
MLKNPICKDCHSLWQEHSNATRDHIRLDNKLQLAALSHDHEVIQPLTQQVETAGALRESTREAIRQHEATHVEDAAAD